MGLARKDTGTTTLCIALLCGLCCVASGCGTREVPVEVPVPVDVPFAVAGPFSISVVPTVPVPIRVGTQLGVRLSSGTAGYAHLYLIDPVGAVSVLAENLPLAAGSLEYPSPEHGFTLSAGQPVGTNTIVLLVTRQPFNGFSGAATLTSPVSLPYRAPAFMSRLNDATASMPRSGWAIDQIAVRVVG